MKTMAPIGARALALCLVYALVAACAPHGQCGFAGCPGDAQITADVRALFDRHPELGPSGLLTVQTHGGVVYLYGVVNTDLVRQQAEAIALQARNAKKVVNSLGVINAGR